MQKKLLALSLPAVSFGSLYAAFVLMVLVLQIFFWMSPTHKEAISFIYLWPAAVTFFGLVLYRERQRLSPGMTLLAAMTIWTFITCLLNGDYYLTLNRSFMLGVVLGVGVCYPTFLILTRWQRRRWMTLIFTALVAALTVLCWLGLYAVITRTLIHSPFGSPPLGIDPATLDGRLYIFGEHPNGMACILSIAIFMAVWLFFSTARLWARILCVIAVFSLYCGLSLMLSRTVVGTLSLGAALFAILCVLRVQPFSKAWKRALCCAVIAVVMIALVFVSTQGLVDMFTDLAAQAEEGSWETVTARDFGEELGSLNKRDEIWAAGFRKIAERPMTLLIGMLDSDVSRLPIVMLDRPGTFHMHNVYLEVLMETGLIGLGLCLCFLWTLLRACWRLFMSKAAPFEARLLAIVPVMLMLNGLLEAYPFLGGRLMDMLFFLIAGAVIACDRDYCIKPTDNPSCTRPANRIHQ